MRKLDKRSFEKRKRQWQCFHRYEREMESRELKELTVRRSYEIFEQLWQFVYGLGLVPRNKGEDLTKYKELAKARARLRKLEA